MPRSPSDRRTYFGVKRDLNLMKLDSSFVVLPLAALILLAAGAGCCIAQSAATAPADAPLDVEQLFASTCGWCHSDGGRVAGKGPQLMDSARTDDYLRNRIKAGKEGAMPAFGAVYNDGQIDEIIKYIRSLKTHQG
jgi:mono/diheme cytochrome c family protein